jgi:hypothetical protein
MLRRSSTANLALVAALIAAGCGGDPVPLTAPTADSIVGTYALLGVNGLPLAPDSVGAPPGLVADTLTLVSGGVVQRARYYSGQTPYLVFRSVGTYTLAGVIVTFSYNVIDDFYGAPLTPIVTGTLAAKATACGR